MMMLAARIRGTGPLILGTSIAVFCLVFLTCTKLVTPVYKASAEIFISAQADAAPGQAIAAHQAPAEEASLNSELQAMRSQDLISRLIDDLFLADDPEFDPGSSFLSDLIRTKPAGLSPAQLQHSRLIAAVVDVIDIRAVPRSAVLVISATTHDPMKSVLIADHLAEIYLSNQKAQYIARQQQEVEWLANRVTHLQAELAQDEAAISAFRTGAPHVISDPLVTYEARLTDLRNRIARLEPAVALENPDSLSQDHFEHLIAAHDDLSAFVTEQGRDWLHFQQLQDQANTTRTLHDYYVTQLKSAAAAEGNIGLDSRIISSASIPNTPHRPRSLVLALTAGLVTLLIGLLAILWKEASNVRFRTERELAQFSGYPVLGHCHRVLSNSQGRPTPQINILRGLRCAIMCAADGPQKTIMVSSSYPDEGGSEVAMTLARSLSDIGKRVLIISGNPQLVEFSKSRDIGKTDQGNIGIFHHVSLRSDVRPLHLKETGADAPMVFARLGEEIARLQADYDHVILDVPALSVCPETRIASRYADGVILAVGWNSTTKNSLDASLDQFEAENLPIIGLVLTRVNPSGLRRLGLTDQFGFHAGYGTA